MIQLFVQSVQDAGYVGQKSEKREYAVTKGLWFGLQNEEEASRTFLKFDLSAVRGKARSVSAVLRIYVDYGSDPTVAAYVTPYMLLEPWDENELSWLHQPEFHLHIRGKTTAVKGEGWYEWDITDIVNAWFSGFCSAYGIVLKTEENALFESKRAIGSRKKVGDESDFSPVVLIQYEKDLSDENVFLIGKHFTEYAFQVITQEEYKNTVGLNVSQHQNFTFFIKNIGCYKAVAKLEISPNNYDYIQDSLEITLLQGEMKPLVPKIYSKYARIAYKSIHPLKETCLLIYYQGSV